jgi:polyribonucleotide nucleotidyltransferase
VEILPNKDGLLHISEIEWKKVMKVEDVLKEGQEVEVKIIDIEPKTGKIKLSRKVLLPKPPREEGERHDDRPEGDRRPHHERQDGDRRPHHGRPDGDRRPTHHEKGEKND